VSAGSLSGGASAASGERPRLAVLAAGGRGERIHPRSAQTPKVMLEVGGKPMLTRQLEMVRDQLGIRRALIVVGYLADHIRAAYGDGASLGMEITYVDNPNVDRGLGSALEVVEPYVHERFVLLLGDEVYLDSNHAELLDARPDDVVVCAVYPTSDLETVRRNYSVTIEGDRITGLVEKPERIASPFVGCGTWLFGTEIFRFVHETPVSSRSGRLELTDVVHRAAVETGRVSPFYLTGHYLNVNTIEDLNLANFMSRSLHFDRHRVSLVIPAYNEADSIGFVVQDFKDHVHEIVVMDNCSKDGTGAIAQELGATVHSQPLRGYGDAIRKGLDAATGDILVVVEADATFRAKDLGKLLEYLKDCDMAIGTRTTRQLIEQGANMQGLLRWGNVVVGKLIEVLWWGVEPRFTDVGCTYRAIWRDAYLRIRDYLTRDDAAFSPEMMIEMLRAQGRVIEIPVSYHRRRGGASKHSASLWHSVRTGLKMLRVILEKRFDLA
jgi:NDP-sugar pyrophosphorylase family protein